MSKTMDQFTTFLTHAANGVGISASIMLRLTVVYFTRWLPLGPRFIPIINTNFTIFLASFIISLISSPKASLKGSKSLISRTTNILIGAYSPGYLNANILTLLINTLFFLASLDFIYRGDLLHQSPKLSFSRTGYVDSSSARVTIRSPSSPHVQISYLAAGTSAWEFGPVIQTTEAADYVATFILQNLESETEYAYRTNASHAGTFHTPSPHPKKWTMISSSCLSPFFPYSPLSHSLSIPGLAHLSAYISTHPSVIQFMLFLGDFIYIDLPVRFGSSVEHYTTAYRKIYASPSWDDRLRGFSWVHAYDDHEITNDWSGNSTGLYQQAIAPWNAYQRPGNPHYVRDGVNYYTISKGDVSIFVLDTRRYRSEESLPDGPEKSMLGPQQLDDVISWLRTERRLKVLVSSVPFMRNWRGPESMDSWAGYLFERQILLEEMWKTEGVMIISGDRHEHATTTFPSPDEKGNVIEFSTSPLSQFYQPFERTCRQEEDSDVMIYSHPLGVSKFGVFEFDTEDDRVWRVRFELVVDGVRVWEYEWSAERRT